MTTCGPKYPRAASSGTRTGGYYDRRTLLKRGAALGCGAFLSSGLASGLAPWVRRAEAHTNGELRVFFGFGTLPESIRQGFHKRTGIRILEQSFGSNAELLNRLKATKGRAFDLINPSVFTAPQWRELKLLKPFDLSRVKTGAISPLMLKQSTDLWDWDGGLHHLPFLWETEALAWRTDKWSRTYQELSYGDLWLPEMKGLVMGAPEGLMLGMGLELDAKGTLPSNRMLDAYKDPESMRVIWDRLLKVAGERKAWLKLFLRDTGSQVGAYRQNGIVLGQIRGGAAHEMMASKDPVQYMAPQEGALAWVDGLSIPVGAVNVDEVYAFIDYILDPKISGALASQTGRNPVVAGAQKHLSPEAKAAFRDSYPEDALNKLWWRPPEEPWYVKARAAYADRLLGA